MNERKQSFFERLTGTQVLDENEREGISYTPPSQGDREEEDSRVTPPEEEYQDYGEGEDDEAGLAIDMYESDNELIIQSMIAGVTPENLNITITRDMVTIRGKRIPPNGVPLDRYMEKELYWGVFSRDIELPFEIDTDGAEAVEKFGLLIIRLPKLDNNRTQELKVKSI